MAIRPVDLQLAYMAAPQNAAVLSAAQEAPQAGQQAAQSAFAAQVTQREEHVDEPAKAEGAKVRPRRERDREPQYRPPHRRHAGSAADEHPTSAESTDGLPEEEQHLIDFTA